MTPGTAATGSRNGAGNHRVSTPRTDSPQRNFSVWLDFIRCSAATFVFLSYACQPGLADAILPDIKRFGRDAVAVFFVISGFVISHTAATRDATYFDLLIARLARLWSVCIPALALAAILGHFGTARNDIDPDFFAGHDVLASLISGHPTIRFIISALFLNESWTLTVIAFNNPPYWSVAYEFCYYLFSARAIT